MKLESGKIYMRLLGGLGNQLFQFASGYGIAQKVGVDLVLDLSAMANYDTWEFGLDVFNLPDNLEIAHVDARQDNKLLGKLTKHLNKNSIAKEHSHSFCPELFEISAPCYLKGYFQSPLYFRHCKKEIRTFIKPAKELTGKNEKRLNLINNNKHSVSLHVRRGDYLKSNESAAAHGVLGKSYYDAALKIFEKLYGDDFGLFLFSDDSEWAEETFSNYPRVDASGDKNAVAWEDLHLMSQCQHNIIANSTFSWWAAWLNETEDKTVIAPRHWFGREKHRHTPSFDMFPDGWITL